MFFIIGLGLGDAKDITLKGLELIQSSDKIYLESYTAILTVGADKLEQIYGKKVIIADRELVEQSSDSILDGATEGNVAFLVVGDPFGATTHTDLLLRAKERNIETKVVHNASIMNAIGCCGLQLYRFGETVSICFWDENWQPESFYDKIISNKERGLHTLCLLDIKVKEQTMENLIKRRPIYEPPRFMTVAQAATQILEISRRRDCNVITGETKCVGLARVGSEDQKIKFASLKEMTESEMGPPLHSFIVSGDLHPLETDFLNKI